MADNNKNLTVYQKLFYLFGQGSGSIKNNVTNKKYSLGDKDLIVSKSKEEFEKERLQQQQQKYLESQWSKVENDLYQKSIFYETSRIASYTDYEAMEFTPEIAVALDIMSEESCTLNEQGNIMSIYSDSSRIKKVLEDLFFNVIDIHSNLPMWTRNTPIKEDSMIPLLDGSSVTIKELSNMVKNGEEVWTYSIQNNTNKLLAGKVVWCDLTRKDSELIRITLDNGTYIDTTPDHEYMLRDGSYCRADKLNEGVSLMPFYTKDSVEKKGYEKVYDPQSNKYDYTHKVVANECVTGYIHERTVNEDFVVHHIDSNKKNNHPNNLQRITFSDQTDLHNKHGETLKKYENESDVIEKSLDHGIKLDKEKVLNHKVLKIEILEEVSDVYCMEVHGPNGERNRHNFPVCSKNLDGDYNRDGVFLSNCKYGDNFVYLKIDYKDGVVGVNQLTNLDIERKETNSFPFQQQNMASVEESKNNGVKFILKDKDLEFNAWEIAHFRLLGDDRKLPYGTSVLEKVRRIWKQLLLAEDAMLVYRVTRAPERRVFKVYVGNIDDSDVEAYVQKVANKFKRTQTSDRETGQTDVRYNTLAVDQDYFVPVRDPNAPMPIETLPGATNLDQIADIQFIQRKMVTALRVPKTFLGFEEAVGEGKNLALMDIRFARTINRIQQAMIQELNKIAIIHLYILGFHDELNNFKLTLNNPSTQGEMLKVEQWKEKVLLYKDLVSGDGGISPTSHTWAKKNIFNWSSDEILEDLEQQRLEKAVSTELEQTSEVIKKTGFFKKVDKLYGELPMDQGTAETEPTNDGGGFGGDEGGFGGGDFGGGDFGGGDFGGGDEGGGDEGGFGESFRGDDEYIDRLLLEGRKKNEHIFTMTKGIDELLEEKNKPNNETLKS